MSVRSMTGFGSFLLGDLIWKFFSMLMVVIHVKADILMEEIVLSLFSQFVYTWKDFTTIWPFKICCQSIHSGCKVTVILFLQVLHISILRETQMKMFAPRRKVKDVPSVIR